MAGRTGCRVARRILAADLRRGSASEKPPAPALLRRALHVQSRPPVLRGVEHLPPAHGDGQEQSELTASSASRIWRPAGAWRYDVGFAISVPRRQDTMNLKCLGLTAPYDVSIVS
jgi:hypothetical protein